MKVKRFDNGKFIVASLLITAHDGVESVEAGRRELSLGYELELVEEGGNYDGQPYDFRQTNIRYNHLAIVDEARAVPRNDTGELRRAWQKACWLWGGNKL